VVYLGLLAAILYISYRGGLIVIRESLLFGGEIFSAATLGRLMYDWLLFFVVLFVAFVAPGISAGAIVSERERQTLHLLQVTMLRGPSIVLGKLGASLSFVTLLVVATAPLFVVPLVLGGVTPGQVVRSFVVMGALMLALASMGLYMSSVARRVQFATVAAYALAFFLVVGTLILFGVEQIWRSTQERNASLPQGSKAIYLSPLVALSDAAAGSVGSSGEVPSPILAGSYIANEATRPPQPMRNGPVVGVAADEQRPLIRLWMINTGLLLVLSAACLYGSARRLRVPAERFLEPKRRKGAT
jgi:ABC-type transport system involved in multi-copper enzyme maturation permease subunit